MKASGARIRGGGPQQDPRLEGRTEPCPLPGSRATFPPLPSRPRGAAPFRRGMRPVIDVWAWTLGSATLVTLTSLVGLAFLAWAHDHLDRLLLYLVSLAAGVLLGAAVFHLIPEAIERLGGEGLRLPLFFLLGFLGFFFLERFLWAHHHGHGAMPVSREGPFADARGGHGHGLGGWEEIEGPDGHGTAGGHGGLDGHVHGTAEGKGGLDGHGHGTAERPGPADTPRVRPHPMVLMSLVGSGLHHLVDGMIIAAAYLTGPGVELGLVTTGAVLLHAVPHEAGDFGILVRGGLEVRRAVLLNLLSTSATILGAVLVLVAGSRSLGLADVLLPISAGNFVYIAAADLIPELRHHHDRPESMGHAFLLLVGVGLMLALRLVGLE